MSNTTPITSEIRIGLAMSGGIALVIYESGVAHELLHFMRAWQDRKGDGEAHGYAAAFREIPLRPVIDILTGASAGGINSVLLGSCISTGNDFTPFHDLWIGKADVSQLRYEHTKPRSLLNTSPLVDPVGQEIKRNAALSKGEPAMEAPDLYVRLCRTHLKGHCLTTRDAIGHNIDELTRNDVIGFETPDFLAWDGKAVSDSMIQNLVLAASATSAFPIAFAPVRADKRYYTDGGLWDNQPIDLAAQAVVDKPAFERTHRCILFIDPQPTRSSDHPTDPAGEAEPTFGSIVFSLPGMGVKGTIWPALDNILDFNQRSELYQTLVSDSTTGPIAAQFGQAHLSEAQKQLAEVTGKPDVDAAANEADAIQVPTLLNQVRIYSLLFDDDPALIQRWNSLVRRMGYKADAPEKSSQQARLAFTTALETLNIIGDYDLQRSAVRRQMDSLNARLANKTTGAPTNQAVVDALQTANHAACKAILYARIDQINTYLFLAPSDPEVVSPEEAMPDYLRDVRHPCSRFRRPSRLMLQALENLFLGLKPGDPTPDEDAAAIFAAWKKSVGERAAAARNDVDRPMEGADLSDASPYATIRLYYRHRHQVETDKGADPSDSHGDTAQNELRAAAAALQFDDPGAIDAAVYVLGAMSDLLGKKPIDLIRISANDTDNTHLIPANTAPAVQKQSPADRKLAGEGLGHFAGLLETRWRRNDYIWGRLDACEILLRMLQQYGRVEGLSLDEERFEELLAEAQTAILQQEARLFQPFDDKQAIAPDPSKVGGIRRAKVNDNGEPIGADAQHSRETQEANKLLIGFGEQGLADIDELALLGDVNYLLRSAIGLIEPKIPGPIVSAEALALTPLIDVVCHMLLKKMREEEKAR